MNRKALIFASVAAAMLAAGSMAYISRGNAIPENPLALSVGPKSLVPMPEFTKAKIKRQEFESVLASVIKHEDWFGSLDFATIRYSTDRTNFPPTIHQMREDLRRDFPKLEITEDAFPHLNNKETGSHRIAFDESRFAFSRQSSVPDYCQSMVWDGSVATGIAGPEDQPTNYFLLGSRVECSQRAFTSFPIIGHAGSSHFEDMFDSVMDERPEISVAVRFNDRNCLVIQTWNDSWIVDREDHRVFARLRYRDVHIFADHREFDEGVYWPMRMTYRRYNDARELSMQVITTVEEFDTRSVPSDALFEQTLIEGTKVADLRHAIPVTYPHDPNRSAEDWKAIENEIAENDLLEQERQARRRSIMGKEAPTFGEGRWLNSDPISISEIRRRGAEIGFVGVSCGPCDQLLPGFSTPSANAGPLKLLVFNCGDDEERIQAKLAPYKVVCPVFVPHKADQHSWGDVFESYRVSGMPTLVTVEPGGFVSAHSLGLFAEE